MTTVNETAAQLLAERKAKAAADADKREQKTLPNALRDRANTCNDTGVAKALNAVADVIDDFVASIPATQPVLPTAPISPTITEP